MWGNTSFVYFVNNICLGHIWPPHHLLNVSINLEEIIHRQIMLLKCCWLIPCFWSSDYIKYCISICLTFAFEANVIFSNMIISVIKLSLSCEFYLSAVFIHVCVVARLHTRKITFTTLSIRLQTRRYHRCLRRCWMQ